MFPPARPGNLALLAVSWDQSVTIIQHSCWNSSQAITSRSFIDFFLSPVSCFLAHLLCYSDMIPISHPQSCTSHELTFPPPLATTSRSFVRMIACSPNYRSTQEASAGQPGLWLVFVKIMKSTRFTFWLLECPASQVSLAVSESFRSCAGKENAPTSSNY